MRYPMLVLCVCLMVGCGESKKAVNTVTGKIFLGERLVNYGTVSFISSAGKPVRSVIYPDGTYNIRQPPLGEVKITVETGNAPIAAAAAGSKGPPPSFKTIVLPAKYSSETETDLRYTVQDGNHTFDIRMTAEAEQTKQ